MKEKRRLFQTVTAGFLSAALLAGPARASGPEIRVSSYKGSTLEAGERSLLIIGPAGAEYTASSGNPEAVAVERVLTYWVAVAKVDGTAEITVTGRSGDTGHLTLIVGSAVSAVPAEPAREDSAGRTEQPEVRQELIRLINETRKASGVAELPVSEALMNAAQAISDRRYTWHHTKEECEAVIACGYPHGFGVNLTVFTGVASEDTAQHAHDNWLNSPGHFETMIKPDCDCIGVGVTESGGVTYCCMFVGRPDTHNPYE